MYQDVCADLLGVLAGAGDDGEAHSQHEEQGADAGKVRLVMPGMLGVVLAGQMVASDVQYLDCWQEWQGLSWSHKHTKLGERQALQCSTDHAHPCWINCSRLPANTNPKVPDTLPPILKTRAFARHGTSLGEYKKVLLSSWLLSATR